ncbi:MAG TPA: HlyC/CorC family transporter [Hyphomicrobiaceae bacterium]|jgi:Mg2+/Co2+ transporter CorB
MTTFQILLTASFVLILIIASAFFSGSETALTAASRARMHALEQEGNRRAQLVNRLLAAPERIIGTVLLGNNLVNILASSLTTGLLIATFGEFGVLYATIVMTAVIVIFAEVLPKTYAIAFPDRLALGVAPVMNVLIRVLWPLTALVQVIVSGILKLTPGRADDDANILAPHEELRGAIELQQKEGTVTRLDAAMLGGVLDLLDLKVLDVMVHRTKMQTLNAAMPVDKLVEEVLKGHYTRLPVWEGEPENIIGVLHTKDLLVALGRANWDAEKIDIKELLKEPWFVPDTTGVKDQLNAFLKRKAHFALVVDEYGEVQGLVTLEDILEEIVGQISDEHDVQDAAIRPQPDGTVNVDGSVPIRDLNRHMGWDLPDEEATTIAGLVIHEAQTIPEPGQAFTFYGYRFEILRKNRNRITALRVKPLKASPPARRKVPASPTRLA